MTDSPSEHRNRGGGRRFRRLLVSAVLLVALLFRLHGVGFGLPALNDPDEPLFMMTAFEMLAKHSFNPEWFGHPATTLLYCLALVMLAVGGIGIASDRFADINAFAGAVYADPGIVFLPARLFIVLCGVACVYLVYRLGRKLGDERLGLLAALFLAVNAVHVQYSQIIRTDVMATVFMLLCVLVTVDLFREGRPRAYVLAGVLVGVACATKWPAALIAASPLCAGLYRCAHGHREVRRLILFGAVAGITLIAVSPYLLLDYPTVLGNLAGEARPFHPGATGGGFFSNLAWYLAHPLAASLGWIGLALAVIGVAWPRRGRREWAIAVLPGAALFLLAVVSQALLWERWIVPLLPFATLALARALCGLADLSRARMRHPRRWLEAAAALVLILPMAQATRLAANEQTHDTRQIASAWVRAHVPAGSTILVEHAAMDLLDGPWTFRFPLGAAGCIDARGALTGRIKYSKVERLRTGRPIIDLGNIDAGLLPSCRADYAILTHVDRYRASAGHFGAELARYRQLLRGSRELAVIRPEPGRRGGPVVHIVKLDPAVFAPSLSSASAAGGEIGQAAGRQHLR